MELLRWILTPLVRLFLRIRYRITVLNIGELKNSGRPVMIISNHNALIDSVIYKCVLPLDFHICGARPVYFSTARKRFLMALARTIRVTTEEQFLEDCTSLLRRKQNILVYPEMSKSARMKSFVDWGAKVARLSGVNVIPVRITGTDEKDQRTIRINIGRPVDYSACSHVEEINDLFFSEIKSL